MASLNVGTTTDLLPPSHRSSNLAPSQEMAYRQKCIDLKRRLSEIEANNDSIRQRLARERRFQDKMRLNRAILLNHMKELVETPSRSYGGDKMGKTSAITRSTILPLQDDPGDGFMLYDSSEISSNDEIKEVPKTPRAYQWHRTSEPCYSRVTDRRTASTHQARPRRYASSISSGKEYH
jgi:hypothetical protein